jgi:excisionase family DNA binding protein
MLPYRILSRLKQAHSVKKETRMKGSRPLTDEEITRIAQSFMGTHALRNRALFLTGVRTGFRISELLSLHVIDVYRNGETIPSVMVAKRYTKGRVEGRTMPLHPEARQPLAEWIAELSCRQTITHKTPVFVSAKGRNRAMTRVQA